jgi:chromosome segregation ATPase
MPESTEVNLGDLKQLIIEIKGDIKQIDNRLVNLEIGQVRMQEKFNVIDERFKGIETRLDDRFNLIDERFKGIETRLDDRFNVIDERFKGIETRLDDQKNALSKIPDLAEKVGELKNWRQIAVIIITGTIGTLLGWIVRSGKY